MYGSEEELCDIIRYYSEHDDKRREIAHNGLETLKANYTYEKQIAKMFEMAFFQA
jgi:spore maturation protein CgeB